MLSHFPIVQKKEDKGNYSNNKSLFIAFVLLLERILKIRKIVTFSVFFSILFYLPTMYLGSEIVSFLLTTSSIISYLRSSSNEDVRPHSSKSSTNM